MVPTSQWVVYQPVQGIRQTRPHSNAFYERPVKNAYFGQKLIRVFESNSASSLSRTECFLWRWYVKEDGEECRE